MIQKGNFLLLDKSEFREWLKKQNVARPIEYLQVHHTYLPNYTTRRNQDPFKCLEGMRNSHLSQGWAATGQNISVLEDGRIAISLDRNLNRIPAGIKGFNSKCICVEIVADFNVGGDKITELQKESVVHLYACLAEKFNIPINTTHIVYHAWVSVTGERLSDYIPGRSSKTCPGTAFWGDGNTIAAANKNFIPQIKAEYQRLTNPVVKDEDQPMTKEEKLAFDELQATVKSLSKQLESLVNSKDVLKKGSQEQGSYIKKVDERVAKLESLNSLPAPPSYAQTAIDHFEKSYDKDGNQVLNTPDGRSKVFYDIATIMYRYLNK
ncbi:peptidoglycan recognition family protein [Paenibacillus sp. Marseille-Q4541]|uniref:peptidoglycan recognition protein family protein n=1 Tax=Paenibacillus sp. Marseille-Q4541 TaxID=2831522 RepID=UPI001BA63A8D|nr:peptidoglycan recognition family protein [Paenibacillus sp. Marseille-Q4541]